MEVVEIADGAVDDCAHGTAALGRLAIVFGAAQK
jgi:hypothetical protein